MKQFDKMIFPPELRGRFNSFIVTEFDDSMTVEMQMRVLIKWIIKNIELTNDMVDYLNKFIEEFDEKLYHTVYAIMNKWFEDGVFNELVLEMLNKFLDIGKFRPFDKTVYDKINNEFSERAVNVKWFGAKGDGLSNDTIAIQDAVNSAKILGFSTYIPDGVFLIDSTLVDVPDYPKYLENNGGIFLPDNTTLIMSDRTILKEINHDKRASNVLRTYRSKNVSIIGGNIEGVTGVAKGREWCYGIAIQGGENVHIKGTHCYNFLGDGINIQRANMNDNCCDDYIPINITIDSVFCDKNGRQGLSIEEVDGCRVLKSVFSNTKGTSPSAGIDIEPAYQNIEKDKPKCENIFISQCEFLNNAGNGLQIIGTQIVKNVSIKDCTFSGNKPDRETSRWSVRLGSCYHISFSNNDLFGEVLSFAGLHNSEINNNRLVDGQITSEISGNSSVLIEGNYFNHTKNISGLHSMYFANGNGLMKDLIVKGNTFRNLVDIDREKPADYGTISAIFILGVGDMIISDNIFIGYDFHIADYTVSQYNKTESLMISGNTFMSSRSQAINTKATYVSILNNSFIGCCFMLGYNSSYSRDAQYTPEKTGGHISFIGNSGVKKPIHDVPFKKLDTFDEVMIHLIKEENNTYTTTIENNNADYTITSPYFFTNEKYGYADTIGSSIKVLNKMPDDFKKFKIGDVLYIMPTNELGFILQNKTFKKIL